MPIEQAFAFATETFAARVTEAVLGFADRIASGSFSVRIERRGLARVVHSRQVEQELDRALVELLKARGAMPSVSFKDPDSIVAIETVGEECGVGLLPRALRTRCPFTRVP